MIFQDPVQRELRAGVRSEVMVSTVDVERLVYLFEDVYPPHPCVEIVPADRFFAHKALSVASSVCGNAIVAQGRAPTRNHDRQTRGPFRPWPRAGKQCKGAIPHPPLVESGSSASAGEFFLPEFTWFGTGDEHKNV